MSDPIFSEIDEEVRREKLKRLWARYGALVVAAALLIVVGIGGWRGYQWWQARQAAQAGAAFERAVALAQDSKRQEAEEAFARLAAEAPAGYRALARLRQAALLAERDRAAAVTLYDALAADSTLPPEMRDVARLRAGILLVDTAPYEQVRERLEPLAGGGIFRHTAREMLALSAWRTGNAAAAKQWIDMVVTDAETPQSTRGRIEMLMALTDASARS